MVAGSGKPVPTTTIFYITDGDTKSNTCAENSEENITTSRNEEISQISHLTRNTCRPAHYWKQQKAARPAVASSIDDDVVAPITAFIFSIRSSMRRSNPFAKNPEEDFPMISSKRYKRKAPCGGIFWWSCKKSDSKPLLRKVLQSKTDFEGIKKKPGALAESQSRNGSTPMTSGSSASN